jgi:hypothetical protein
MSTTIASVDFLTVATVSYAPQALATLRSAQKHGRYVQLHFFALDATQEGLLDLRRALGEDASSIQLFGPHDLNDDDRSRFLSAFKYYNGIEMSCLAKYVGVAHVLRHSTSADRCVYADADILFFGDTVEAISELGEKAILLTPHQFAPSTDAAEHDYILHGWVNAGFFVANRGNPDVNKLLGWLVNRILRRGFLAPSLGLSCDQTWVSLLPAMFSEHVAISRNSGYNVAYWNLHERKLAQDGGIFLANGTPLVFFHFSGFLGATPGKLTRHGDHVLPPHSPLETLCRSYRQMLDDAATLSANTIATLPCSTLNLQGRILLGSKVNQLYIDVPTLKRGIFARIGMRLDAMLSRWQSKADRQIS